MSPTQDDLKMARDGQLSAGRPPPVCGGCGKPFEPGEKQAVAHVDSVRKGRRVGGFTFWHDRKDCLPEWMTRRRDSVTREEEA